MESYMDWRTSHPIRQWARDRNIPLVMLAAKLEMSSQGIHEWLRSNPPDSPRFSKLCAIMQVKPDALREQIAAWQKRGNRLEL